MSRRQEGGTEEHDLTFCLLAKRPHITQALLELLILHLPRSGITGAHHTPGLSGAGDQTWDFTQARQASILGEIGSHQVAKAGFELTVFLS